MGFTPTFYAGRPKLSEITIDSDLDMGGRNILRARIGSPYIPETWPTEELDWGDVAPSEVVTHERIHVGGMVTYNILTAESPTEVRVRITSAPESPKELTQTAAVNVSGGPSFSVAGLLPGESVTTPAYILNPGDSISAYLGAYGSGATVTIELIYTGRFVQGRTFDLTGKWLALGIDMKGLAATVKIQGVEMPYSDYAKYFPLAPTELKIPGGWSPTQIRPIVEVYK